MTSPRVVDVALFAPTLGGGGAERVLLNLAIAFDARDLNVDVVLVSATGTFVSQLPSGIRVVDLRARSALRSIPALVRYLRLSRPRSMLSALGHANVAAIVARAVARVGCVLAVSIHNTSSEAVRAGSFKTRVLTHVERVLYHFADVRIAVSRGVRSDFARTTGFPLERIRVIYNPVLGPTLREAATKAVDHPWLQGDAIPTLIAVGRLSPQKDYPTLFQAFAEVRRTLPARLIVLGEGAARPELEALRKSLHLEEVLDMPGFAGNPYSMMARADVFVLSSRYEGLPTVLIEALGVGARVVATDCPSGPAEILDGGRYGELVPVGDHVALARAIVDALASARSTVQTREAITPYEVNTVVPQYLTALRLQR